ncbi:MAG: ATP-binding cassette domain-containing protein [Tissierellia bacterium]|nr:ATP-binding cassette domain-containing protein [Tissierellia bacterium]
MEKKDRRIFKKGPNQIIIENLFFRYDNGKVIFQNFNLRLEQNGLHSLKGENGSVKTTLFNLIAGLLEADEGTITIVTEKEKDQKIIMMPQENEVFQDRVLNNVTMYDPSFPSIKKEKETLTIRGRRKKIIDTANDDEAGKYPSCGRTL